MSADREREDIQARNVSDDRLGGLARYYLNRLDGQGDMKDLFAHIAWQDDALAACRARNETLAVALRRIADENYLRGDKNGWEGMCARQGRVARAAPAASGQPANEETRT